MLPVESYQLNIFSPAPELNSTHFWSANIFSYIVHLFYIKKHPTILLYEPQIK